MFPSILWIAAACAIPATAQIPTLSSKTTVVLVPALVTDKDGQSIFTLTADDFTVTDDGVPQKVHLEEDSDSEPLALVVAIQTGGSGAHEIDKFRQLAPLIEAIPGNVPHRIAVVTFGSTPKLLLDFTPESKGDSESVEEAIKGLSPGDSGGAILDTLGYAVDLLRDQPPKYRRAILLLSDTHDDLAGQAGHLTIDQALRAVSDTNTTIYSFAFSTTRSDAGTKAAHAFNNPNPGPRHGCMANENTGPAEDSSQDGSATDATGDDKTDSTSDSGNKAPKRTGKQIANQATDCLGLLLPPLALAKMAVEAGISGLRRNIPETVADLTGGEYYSFKNPKTIQRDFLTIANHVPNRYVLSFQPRAPHPGLHSVTVRLKSYPKLEVSARTSYWADPESGAEATPAASKQ